MADSSRDEVEANLMAAGGLYWLLRSARRIDGPLSAVELVMSDGFATNQIDIGLDYLESRYRVTVERVPESPGMCSCWHHLGRLSCPVHPLAPARLPEATDSSEEP
jgi:hypothetical protein